MTRLRITLLGVLVALAAAGCGGDDEDSGTGAQTAPATPTAPAPAQTDTVRERGKADSFEVRELASGLDQPLGLVPEPGSDDLYVLEQPGRVRILRDGNVVGEPFLDITDRVSSGGERGLLGLAFHPGYQQNGRFFVHYTDKEGNTRVDEMQAEDGSADSEPARRLLAVEQPFPNHNGGQLLFGPDGLLYLGLGDGGGAYDREDNAQDLDSRLGKLLRLDVDSQGADWQVAAYGLRNPWRFSVDPETDAMWIADVGQDEREEIDVLELVAGGTPPNFGWPAFEGTNDPDEREPQGDGRLLAPVAEYDHDDGCSTTGGYVYRGSEVPDLRGRYIFGDFCSGVVWTLQVDGVAASDMRRESEQLEQLSSFGEDNDGELYAITLDGRVLRLTATPD
jgi:glucose/arabinose dehydrogenase